MDIDINYKLSTVVSKPLEKLRYSRRVDNNSIATSYFECEEISSSKNVVVEDHSFNYAFNDRRKLDQQKYKEVENLKYNSLYKDILFSVYTGVNKHGESIPLFYKQKKDPNKKILSVSIEKLTNSSTGDADQVNYGYAIVNGDLYYNYENKYNATTKEYEIYYLTIRYSDNTSENTIINPVPAIEKRTASNSDQITYTQYKIARGYEYSILTPGNKTVAEILCQLNLNFKLYIKELDTNSIYIKKPENQNVENEWIPEIVAGEVYKITDTEVLRYHIPEYRNQNFSIEAPNLQVFDKDCYVVTEKIIKLPLSKITYDNADFSMQIQKYDLNNEPVGGSLEINTVDERNGFVELTEQLSFQNGEDYYIRASFFYKTNTYYYNKLDLNPFFNKENIKQKYHFFVKPNEDVSSIVVQTSKNNADPNWLYLGAIFYEEDYNKEKSFSFSLEKRARFFSLDDAIKKNPYILQSYLGYGPDGQALQKNNVVVIDLPAEYENEEFYTEQELINLFKRKLRPSTNIILNYVEDEPVLKFKTFKAPIVMTLSWEGPGGYEVFRSKDPNFTDRTLIYSKTINEEDSPYLIDIEDDTVESNRLYYYQVRYNDKKTKRKYSLKVGPE